MLNRRQFLSAAAAGAAVFARAPRAFAQATRYDLIIRGGRVRVDGTLEVFNLFNHENFGNYTTIVTNSSYGQTAQIANVVYNPRTVQLGVRFSF